MKLIIIGSTLARTHSCAAVDALKISGGQASRGHGTRLKETSNRRDPL